MITRAATLSTPPSMRRRRVVLEESKMESFSRKRSNITLPAYALPSTIPMVEFSGCTLPPKVTGLQYGALILSIPHILPSTAVKSDTATSIPCNSLVRVRWWGEEKPGSLFRPKRISHEAESIAIDDDENESQPIQMRYPLCVPAPQLLDYFRDMNALVLDVVDRQTRKKYGQCTIPLRVQDMNNSDSDASSIELNEAEAQLRSFCHDNTLLEIHGIDDSQKGQVLGYLAVNLSIEWTRSTVQIKSQPLSTPTVHVNQSLVMDHSLHQGEPKPPTIRERFSFSSLDSNSEESVQNERHISYKPHYSPHTRRHRRRDDMNEQRKSSSPYSTPPRHVHIRALIDKGRALEQSMARATIMKETIEKNDVDPLLKEAHILSLLQEIEDKTEDTSWEQILNESREVVSSTIVPMIETHDISEPPKGSILVFECATTGIEILINSMMLEPRMMEKLSQLRDTTVSTRFSPIEITLSYDHPSMLVRTNGESIETSTTVTVCTVQSSLRKRQWELQHIQQLPIVQAPMRAHIVQDQWHLRVRCQAQLSGPGRRRNRQLPHFIDLIGSISTIDLLEYRKEWKELNIPLRLESVSTNKRIKVGSVQLKIRSCSVETKEADKEIVSNVSSEWEMSPKSSLHFPHSSLSPIVSTFHDKNPLLLLGLLIQHVIPTGITPSSSIPIRLEYAIPGFLSAHPPERRILHTTMRSDNHKATFNHSNAFPFHVHDDIETQLQNSMMIIEIWQPHDSILTRHYQDHLIGLVKVPLDIFSTCFRNDISTTHVIPWVGVNGLMNIIDPFTATVMGSIQMYMVMGTAEQVWRLRIETIQMIIRWQSIVRGYLVRKRLARWQSYALSISSQSDKSSRCSEVENKVQDETRVVCEVRDHPNHVEKGVQDETLVICEVPDRPIHKVGINLQIRKCWSDVVTSSSVGKCLGYTVLGQLHACGEADGIPFSLWWDARDASFNSHFIHSIIKNRTQGIEIQDLDVLFQIALPGKEGTGVAAFNVATMLHLFDTRFNSSMNVTRAIDVPLVWNNVSVPRPDILPLQVILKVEPHVESETIKVVESDQVLTRTVKTRTERLLPATLVLCLDFQRIINLFDLLAQTRIKTSRIELGLEYRLCLGIELHEREKQRGSGHYNRLVQDDDGRWYRHVRYQGIVLDGMTNSVQSLPSFTRSEIYVMVHGELVQELQEATLDVRLVVQDDIEVGMVSIPLSAMLFRPTGVVGSFPVCIKQEADQQNTYAGRVGVHLYVDQEEANGRAHIKTEEEINAGEDKMSEIEKEGDSVNVCIVEAEKQQLEMSTFEIAVEEAREGNHSHDHALLVGINTIRLSSETDTRTDMDAIQITEGCNGIWNISISVNSLSTGNDQHLHLELYEQVNQTKRAIGHVRVPLSILVVEGWNELYGWYHVRPLTTHEEWNIKLLVKKVEEEKTVPASKVETEFSSQLMIEMDKEVEDKSLVHTVASIDKATRELNQRLDRLKAYSMEGSRMTISDENIISIYAAEIEHDDCPSNIVNNTLVADTTVQSVEEATEVMTASRADGNDHANNGQDDSGNMITAKTSCNAPLAGQIVDNEIDVTKSRDDVEEIPDTQNTISTPKEDHHVEEKEEETFDIDVDSFPTLTLASFGIEEMQLSPIFSDDGNTLSPIYTSMVGTPAQSIDSDTIPMTNCLTSLSDNSSVLSETEENMEIVRSSELASVAETSDSIIPVNVEETCEVPVDCLDSPVHQQPPELSESEELQNMSKLSTSVLEEEEQKDYEGTVLNFELMSNEDGKEEYPQVCEPPYANDEAGDIQVESMASIRDHNIPDFIQNCSRDIILSPTLVSQTQPDAQVDSVKTNAKSQQAKNLNVTCITTFDEQCQTELPSVIDKSQEHEEPQKASVFDMEKRESLTVDVATQVDDGPTELDKLPPVLEPREADASNAEKTPVTTADAQCQTDDILPASIALDKLQADKVLAPHKVDRTIAEKPRETITITTLDEKCQKDDFPATTVVQDKPQVLEVKESEPKAKNSQEMSPVVTRITSQDEHSQTDADHPTAIVLDKPNVLLVTASESVDDGGALPIHKFNVAWQLLHEIRELYVDQASKTSPQSISSTYNVPSESNRVEHDIDSAQVPGPSLTQKSSIETDPLQITIPTGCMETAIPHPVSPIINHSIPGPIQSPLSHVITSPHTPLHQHDVLPSISNDKTISAYEFPQYEWKERAALQYEIEKCLPKDISLHDMENSQTLWHLNMDDRIDHEKLCRKRRQRSLFNKDTETERIARIMQGTFQYWLEEVDDEEEPNDDTESDED